MATLSPRTRRPDDEIELAVHERRARHIIELVDAWGMTRDRQAHAPVEEDVRLHFDGFERAHIRTVADVWRRR